MKKFILVVGIFALGIACSSDSDNDGGGSTENPFAVSDLLVSWADDFIIPQYDAFLIDAQSLTAAKDLFIADPTEVNLAILSSALTKAYVSFQPVAVYAGLGRAEELNYYFNLNAHSLDVDETLANIAIYDTADLTSVLNQDTQGLPAVDYLVNGLGASETEIVAFYTGDEAENYKGYLSKVVDRIESLTTIVSEDWNNGYRETFVNNTSSASSGSFDTFINVYIEYFEKRLRASKVGTPLGQFTEEPFPNEIESLYNPTLSKTLLIEALDNAEALYLGVSGSEVSLSAVLIELEKLELDTLLKGYFDAAQTEIENELNDNLKLQIETDVIKMRQVRDALQNIIMVLKSDMVSALGVDITFLDNDGD